MPFELGEIKEIRKKIGITQSKLARIACVSQSLIAKIESDRIDPTYSKTQRIFNALHELSKSHDITADEIMQKKIISIGLNDEIGKIIDRMKKYEISQMPVIEENKCVGLITESIILNSLIGGKKGSVVRDVMQDSPPIISRKSSIKIISELLRFYPMVLIAEKGKLTGLITKSDMIRRMYK